VTADEPQETSSEGVLETLDVADTRAGCAKRIDDSGFRESGSSS